MLASTYLRTLSPSHAIKGRISEEEWTETRQSVKHLQIFEYEVYEHVDKENRIAGCKIEKCRFIGYIKNRKEYKFLSWGSSLGPIIYPCNASIFG